jgi:ribosomal protein S18 acetylase RimI-like enzyme
VEVRALSRFKGNNIEIRPMRETDIPESRRVGQEAWSDLVSRDIGRKIRYPIRPRRIVETYMWKEPKGCLVVYEDNHLVGSAFSHVWGKVGWVGPIEILPESQNRGVGRMLLDACEEYLRERECRVIGVETMPNIPKNLHFYIMGGYVPRQLTLITEKPVRVSESRPIPLATRELEEKELDTLLPRIVDLSKQVNPLLDYSIEFKAMFKKRLGQCMVIDHDGEVGGVALLHSYNRSGDSNFCSIKLVLVDGNLPNPWEAFVDLIFACENKALELGRKRIYSRFSGDNPKMYSIMTNCGFRLANSNIRVVKDGDYIEKTDFHISSWAG